MRTALALSPHLDDAAFSAGAALARLSRRGWRVVVATVFTGTVARPQGFALACQLDKGLPPEADYMALRRAEDETACAALGAEVVHLPLLEAPHRGYEDPRALFAGVRDDDEAVGDARDLAADLLTRLRPDLLLLPRAVGRHVDHVVLRRAVWPLARPVTACWTDWPYAGRQDAAEPFAAEDGAARAVRVPAGPDLSAKLTACAAYETQLGYQFGGVAEMRASLRAARRERFALHAASA